MRIQEKKNKTKMVTGLGTLLLLATAIGGVATGMALHDDLGQNKTAKDPNVGVARSLPTQVECGQTFTVILHVTPPKDTTSWFIDERPPEELNITAVTGPNGEYMDDQKAVKWVALNGNEATVTYDAQVPLATSTGTTLTFAGEFRLHPKMDERAHVAGDNKVTVTCPDGAPDPTDPKCVGPQKIHAHTEGPTNVIQWSVFADAEAYNLYRAEAGESYELLVTTGAGENRHDDSDVEIGTTYQYRVTAVVDGQETNHCDEVEITAIPVFTTVLAALAAAGVAIGGYALVRRRS